MTSWHARRVPAVIVMQSTSPRPRKSAFPKRLSGNRSRTIWQSATLVLAVCIGALATADLATFPPDENLASIVRGGRLYDRWYTETGEPVPRISHPAYPADGPFTARPERNWRCTECHGWDYKGRAGAYSRGFHFTGIAGIRSMAGADPDTIIAVLKDDTHGYGDVLDQQEFWDLANFVGQGQIDMDAFIDPSTRIARGDAASSKVYFATICANCHGKDGQEFRDIQSVGKTARENPWKALHTILNGHPGENMPALRAFDLEILVGILAYAQTLPTEEILASIVRGGRLYDNWYTEVDSPAPAESHPSYPEDKAFAGKPEASWRCKECHGWDYLGRSGAYAEGKHYTGISGIQRMAGVDPERIVRILTDDVHRYDELLDSRDREDLANFVSRGQVEMNRFIDRETMTAKGDKEKHIAYYTTICATCHGIDGRKIITMRPLGQFARGNPWATLHRILNGHPDEEMPALRVLEPEVLADILAYVQTL